LFDKFETKQIDTGETTIHTLIGGKGPPLLLLHGYPQTHVMWHKIAPELARHFTVIATDLRGYGDSGKPDSDDEHLAYSKRATAADQIKVMEELGFHRFMVAGHDRGGRVTHRMCLDYPDHVLRASILDIIPTPVVFGTVNQRVATAYYHWFFLIQPFDLPETLIGANPEYFLRKTLRSWAATDTFSDEAFSEYLRAFRDSRTIHATCEDYRAGASIDLKHHKEDEGRKIACPVQILWGEKGLVGSGRDPLEIWREWADDVTGKAMPSGHFIPEEAPKECLQALLEFFAA
jgi:haloacetate dehalogenase